MNKKRVAVIGAAGQVGSALVRQLLNFDNIHTIGICRNTISAGMIKSMAPDCEIRIGSITEKDSAKKILGDCDIIINCALAMISGKPKESRQLNEAMIDTFCRLERVNTIVHMSSLSVYGSIIDFDKFPKNSFDRPRPQSDYGRSKLHIENYAIQKFSSKNLKYYILRLGHVYGAETDRSREIIGLINNQDFKLPFDGKIPSNAVHAERLASMTISLFDDGSLPAGIYNAAEEQSTWRDVFNWHTQTLDLHPVKAMTQFQSEKKKAAICSASFLGDIFNWLRSMPFLSLIKYPVVFDYISRILYLVPTKLTSHFAAIFKRLDVKRQLGELNSTSQVNVSALYYSDAMPGPYLENRFDKIENCPTQKELNDKLRKWHNRFANVCWLRESTSGKK